MRSWLAKSQFAVAWAIMGRFLLPIFLAAVACVSAESQVSAPAAFRPERPPDLNTPRELNTAPAGRGLRSIRVLSWNIDRGARLDTIASELGSNSAGLCL